MDDITELFANLREAARSEMTADNAHESLLKIVQTANALHEATVTESAIIPDTVFDGIDNETRRALLRDYAVGAMISAQGMFQLLPE